MPHASRYTAVLRVGVTGLLVGKGALADRSVPRPAAINRRVEPVSQGPNRADWGRRDGREGYRCALVDR